MLRVDGPVGVLPSIFDVTGFASGAVAAAALALAELAAARSGDVRSQRTVHVDRLGASASFKCESLVRPIGWTLPPISDPLGGDYRAQDRWIRLVTNYPRHKKAALDVLGSAPRRSAVSEAVSRWNGDDLERAVIAAGGCAAVMRTSDEWSAHPAGKATSHEPAVVLTNAVALGSRAHDLAQPRGEPPLAGIRVLDLTRVIAGPVATRYLAAYGAYVLRIDPPGFPEVQALLPEATPGKRCTFLDLADSQDRRRFESLVADAHVIVGGLRPDAMAKLGYGRDALRAINPAIVSVNHSAYGWQGPWASRRGFDGLVQMSSGIAAAGTPAANSDTPTLLPAHALDHGLGHLLAAGVCRALSDLVREGMLHDVRGSLLGAATTLKSTLAPEVVACGITVDDAPRERANTEFGEIDRVPLAGTIEGYRPYWREPAGPLGRHEASF